MMINEYDFDMIPKIVTNTYFFAKSCTLEKSEVIKFYFTEMLIKNHSPEDHELVF